MASVRGGGGGGAGGDACGGGVVCSSLPMNFRGRHRHLRRRRPCRGVPAQGHGDAFFQQDPHHRLHHPRGVKSCRIQGSHRIWGPFCTIFSSFLFSWRSASCIFLEVWGLALDLVWALAWGTPLGKELDLGSAMAWAMAFAQKFHTEPSTDDPPPRYDVQTSNPSTRCFLGNCNPSTHPNH
jgi:hypothetical protein